MTIQEDLQSQFFQHFSSKPQDIYFAPGRVNLIGDHTDYNDGFVLPSTIQFGTYVAAKARQDHQVNVLALDFNHDTDRFDLRHIPHDTQRSWVNYVRGTLKFLLEKFPEIKGTDIAISGNVPLGAGLSSSASLEMVILKAYNDLYDLALTGINAALIGQKAENKFVGCNCGIMDQLISALGKPNSAMLLDCRSLEVKYINLPQSLSLLVINSNIERGLVDSEYNLRRQQCEQAALHFGKAALRDISLDQLSNEAINLDPILYKRAKHVISENTRTQEASQALANNNISALSTLMSLSHLSLKDDFSVTTHQLDYLVEIVSSVLGNQGGVRMTGGGFGGCVITLTPQSLVKEVCAQVNKQYKKLTGLSASIYACFPSKGAFSQPDLCNKLETTAQLIGT